MPFPKSMTVPSVWREHDERVKPYVWSHRAVGWGKSLLGLVLLIFFLRSGMGQKLEISLSQSIAPRFLLWLAYFGIIGAVWEVLGFPFDVGHYLVEKKFNLSKQSFGSWVADKAKGWALGAGLGTIAMGLLYLSQRWFPEIWWIVACTCLVGFSIVLAQLAPVLLIPLFFKLKPMTESPLKERLLKLCQGFSIEVKEIYHLGMGEKTEKGNAAFTGLGRTKRILIGDTLYERYSADEVEAVFAHELGHQVNNDLWKGIFLSATGIYLAFFVAQWLVNQYLLPQLSTEIYLPYGLFIFFIVLSFVQFPIGVVQATYSRSREHAADKFAAETIGLAEWLAVALEKLTLQNFGFFRPNPMIEFLTHSHPAPCRRIAYLNRVGKR